MIVSSYSRQFCILLPFFPTLQIVLSINLVSLSCVFQACRCAGRKEHPVPAIDGLCTHEALGQLMKIDLLQEFLYQMTWKTSRLDLWENMRIFFKSS
ncbi:hypothetical protein AMECASPLE_037025 [Ameca splendens]|uniref:Secreted protein n=1 Tax=Ameca splendens TaxID=208324 RepID=A0ABV0ZHB0_9TELE